MKNKIKLYLTFSILFLGLINFGQTTDNKIPEFINEIHKEHPNYFTANNLFEEYMREYEKINPKNNYKEEEEEEEFSSQYEKEFKEWNKYVMPYVQSDGSIVFPTIDEITKDFNAKKPKYTRGVNINTPSDDKYNSDVHFHTTLSPWSYQGPVSIYEVSRSSARTANVRAFAQSKINPNYLYSAVESGTIYVSRNKGKIWHYATIGYNIRNVTALAVSPNDEKYAYAGNDNGIYRTTDGGITWNLFTR